MSFSNGAFAITTGVAANMSAQTMAAG